MTAAQLQRAADLTAAAGSWLVVDNTYEHFTYDGAEHTCASGANVVNIFSFSKAYGMMGWRVGYISYPSARVHATLGSEMLKIQDTIPICATQISQLVALESLREGRGWVTERVQQLSGRSPPVPLLSWKRSRPGCSSRCDGMATHAWALSTRWRHTPSARRAVRGVQQHGWHVTGTPLVLLQPSPLLVTPARPWRNTLSHLPPQLVCVHVNRETHSPVAQSLGRPHRLVVALPVRTHDQTQTVGRLPERCVHAMHAMSVATSEHGCSADVAGT